ncbi:hypothetical protein ACFPIF_15480 [Brevundimonas faecalis]|uniref:hypothetical protein n=1 Tax=Brevundimonas faecalis TaxID=947378 RepID=UPI00361D723D
MIGLPVTDAMLACAPAQIAEDVGQNIIDYVTQKGPVSARDITRKFQGFKASVIHAALARAAEQGALTFQRFQNPRGGSARTVWQSAP